MDTTTNTQPAPYTPTTANLAVEVYTSEENRHTMVTIVDDDSADQMVRIGFSFSRKNYRTELNTRESDMASNLCLAQRVFAGLALLEAMEAQGYTIPTAPAPVHFRTR